MPLDPSASSSGARKRILVVCYSLSGTTQALAEAIAHSCDAELELIRDRTERRGWFGRLRSAFEALLRRDTWIRPARHPLKDYSLVIFGSPVWAWNLASPVRAYARRYGPQCRRVAFFCTTDGGGAGRVLADLERLCGRRPQARLALTRRAVRLGRFDAEVDEFVRRLQPDRGTTTTSGMRMLG